MYNSSKIGLSPPPFTVLLLNTSADVLPYPAIKPKLAFAVPDGDCTAVKTQLFMLIVPPELLLNEMALDAVVLAVPVLIVNPLIVTLPTRPAMVTTSPAVELPDSSIKVVPAPAPVNVMAFVILTCST